MESIRRVFMAVVISAGVLHVANIASVGQEPVKNPVVVKARRTISTFWSAIGALDIIG